MTERLLAGSRPERLLLATDLSSRTDRALDRATQLARHWGAELHVVHAVDAQPTAVPAGVDSDTFLRRYPDRMADAKRRMSRLLRDIDLPAHVHVEEGTAASVILAVCERRRCDLVVLGESCEGAFNLVESTLEQIVRKVAASVLVVRNRGAVEYRSLLVGTDYTAEARQSLVVAANLFPDARLVLMHGYQIPYAGLLNDAEQLRALADDERTRLAEHVEASGLPADRREAVRQIAMVGPPSAVLREYVEENDIDLTIIGAHPRGLLFDAVVGRSRTILSAIPGDILVVRAVRRAEEA